MQIHNICIIYYRYKFYHIYFFLTYICIYIYIYQFYREYKQRRRCSLIGSTVLSCHELSWELLFSCDQNFSGLIFGSRPGVPARSWSGGLPEHWALQLDVSANRQQTSAQQWHMGRPSSPPAEPSLIAPADDGNTKTQIHMTICELHLYYYIFIFIIHLYYYIFIFIIYFYYYKFVFIDDKYSKNDLNL